MRRTKIVATIGPVSKNESVLQDLLQYADLVRINFSHADHHPQAAEMIRKIAKSLNRTIGLIADLQGPKIRVSRFKNGKVFLKDGADFILDAAHPADEGNENIVGIDYKELPKDVSPNDVLLLSDGRIVFIVTKVEGTKIYCKVESGGELSNNKGINRKGGGLSAPALTDKDREDLKIAVSMNVDYIAISFPRCADDIEEAKDLIAAAGGNAGVIAKIERIEAVEPKTLDEIIDISDGIMVARGDLGVEIPLEDVPLIQKRLIHKANMYGKPVITATQMLESMIENPRPTRAEVSDVANAVYDGTDAVMLSGETAAGKYPVQAAEMMAQIATETEGALPYEQWLIEKRRHAPAQTDDAISYAACAISQQIGARCIVAYTRTGSTALRVSKYKPKATILAITPDDRIFRRLALSWGVEPYLAKAPRNVDVLFQEAAMLSVKTNLAKSGDLIAITAGIPMGVTGSTNIIKVHRIE